MGPCPACGADRLVPLTFQAARATAGDLDRPEVVSMRPLAKCGECGGRIYPDGVRYRDDPRESAPPN
jgi:predicted metal-binding protein